MRFIRKSQVFRTGGHGQGLSFNMTPLIDVTFQLIIFFILAGQMASRSLSQVQLPRPHESQAQNPVKLANPNKLIVNVISADEGLSESSLAFGGRASRYEVDGYPIEIGDRPTLVDIITARKEKGGGDFAVEVRADRLVNFEFVAPVIKAATEAKVARMNITALLPVDDER